VVGLGVSDQGLSACFETKGEMATHVLFNYFLAFGGAQVQVLQLAALQCLQQWYLRPLFN
jgi:hypothetical protein